MIGNNPSKTSYGVKDLDKWIDSLKGKAPPYSDEAILAKLDVAQ